MDVALSGQVYEFLLVFARVGSMIMLLPGFANPGPPARIRLSFALVLTLVILPDAAPSAPEFTTTRAALAVLMAEVILGLALGTLLRFLMMALAVAGQIIAMQTGMAMAMNFDPAQNQQGAVFSTFLSVLATTLIFVTGLHHAFMQGIAGSYNVLPPGLNYAASDFAVLSLDLVSQGMGVAMQMASPLIVFGIVFYSGMGVVAKLMPQANIFFISMPLNILFGLVIFAATLGTILLVWLDFAERFVSRLV